MIKMSYFVGHQLLIVPCVRVGSKVHEELCHFHCAAHGSKVQGRVALLVGEVVPGAVLQQKLEYFVLGVMSGCFEQGSPLVFVHFVHVRFGDDQFLHHLQVLLHARKRKGALAVFGADARVGSEVEQHFYDFEVVVDRGLHEAGEAEVVLDVDVKDLALALALVVRPVLKQKSDCVRESVCARDVQGVAAVGVREVDVNALFEKQLEDADMVLSSCD